MQNEGMTESISHIRNESHIDKREILPFWKYGYLRYIKGVGWE